MPEPEPSAQKTQVVIAWAGVAVALRRHLRNRLRPRLLPALGRAHRLCDRRSPTSNLRPATVRQEERTEVTPQERAHRRVVCL